MSVSIVKFRLQKGCHGTQTNYGQVFTLSIRKFLFPSEIMELLHQILGFGTLVSVQKDDGIWKCCDKILLSWLSWEYYKGFVTFVTFARWVLLPSLPNSSNLVKWPKTDHMWRGDHTKDVSFHKSGQGCIGCRNNILCIHLLLCFTSTSTGCVVPTGSFNTNILV